MQVLKALALLLLSLPAFAQQSGSVVATLTWEPPTAREDGSALPESEIDHFDIQAVTTAGAEHSIEVARAADGTLVTTYRHIIKYEFGPAEKEVIYTIRTTDVYGMESRWSDPVSYKAVIAPSQSPPSAPLNFSIGVECQDCSLLERQ